jgi:MFS family permease
MLLWGAIVMCVCEYLVAIVGVTKGDIAPDGSVNLAAQRVLIAFVCVYIAFFAASWGPIAWCVSAEQFPSRHRAKGMSFAAGSNWLWNFGIGYATPYLVNKSTPEVAAAGLGVKVFFIWGSTCAGCAIFSYFFVPETKGLTLEDVDELYRSTNMRNSNKWRTAYLAQQARDGAALPTLGSETASGELRVDEEKI